MGRTGRFGTLGVAISLIGTQEEHGRCVLFGSLFNCDIDVLPQNLQDIPKEYFEGKVLSESERSAFDRLHSQSVAARLLKSESSESLVPQVSSDLSPATSSYPSSSSSGSLSSSSSLPRSSASSSSSYRLNQKNIRAQNENFLREHRQKQNAELLLLREEEADQEEGDEEGDEQGDAEETEAEGDDATEIEEDEGDEGDYEDEGDEGEGNNEGDKGNEVNANEASPYVFYNGSWYYASDVSWQQQYTNTMA